MSYELIHIDVMFIMTYFLGLSPVSFVWIQPLPPPVPIPRVQCPRHSWLWGTAVLAVHCHYSDIRIQVKIHPTYVGMLLWFMGYAWLHTCSARFSKLLSNRSSVEGIWFLSIITYKYTADTCFTLLRCQRVSGGESGARFVSHPLMNECVSVLLDSVVQSSNLCGKDTMVQ